MEKGKKLISLTENAIYRFITVSAGILIGVLTLFLIDSVNQLGITELNGNFLQSALESIGATAYNVNNNSWYVTLFFVILTIAFLIYKLFSRRREFNGLIDLLFFLTSLLLLLSLTFMFYRFGVYPFDSWNLINVVSALGVVYVVACVIIGIIFLVTAVFVKIKKGKNGNKILTSEEFPSEAME